MTPREQLAIGPKWVGVPPGESPPFCAACSLKAGLYGEWLDKETGLCRPCWRGWRFSAPVMAAVELEAYETKLDAAMGPRLPR